MKILVVEDESIVGRDLEMNLTDLGYQVTDVVGTGEEAIRRAVEDRPDLILMDVVLKGEIDGIEAAGEIGRRADIPVVYLTAYSDREVVERAKLTGPFGYLIKPFNTRDLHIAIEIALYKHQLEMRLKESEEWLDTTLKSIGDGVIATDHRGRVRFMNKTAMELTGWSMEEAAGRHLWDVFHLVQEGTGDRIEFSLEQLMGREKAMSVDNFQLATREGRELSIDGVLLSKGENRKYIVEDSVASIRHDSSGRVRGIVVAFRDVTRRKSLEAQLVQAQKMEAIGTLAGGIAHDFNNILTAIVGFTEMARERLPRESSVISDLDEVLKAGDRAKDLVTQILTFSRQTDQECKPLQISLVIKEALKLLRASIPTTIDIRQDIDPDCGAVVANPTQIHQILLNLCTNAMDAMLEEGGVMSVSLHPVEEGDPDFTDHYLLEPGPYVRLEVSDTGRGMSRAVQERIFEPYFTTKEKGKGTGLGLALLHGIVKNHRGYVFVKSEEGRGTTFQVYLPSIEMTAKDLIGPAEEVPGGSERILFVDDEQAIIQVGTRILESLGYRVSPFSGSREALMEFRQRPYDYDLVVTDQTMPRMTGAELTREVLKVRPEMPVILCTGFSEIMNEKKARAIGIREYVMKPLLRGDLAKIIRKVLDGGKPNR